jgi:hypothetical protein
MFDLNLEKKQNFFKKKVKRYLKIMFLPMFFIYNYLLLYLTKKFEINSHIKMFTLEIN